MTRLKEEVWALIIDSGCGTSPRVFWSKEAAKAALTDYVRDRWGKMGDPREGHAQTQDDFDALPDDDAIAEYFDGIGCEEWFVLEPVMVEG